MIAVTTAGPSAGVLSLLGPPKVTSPRISPSTAFVSQHRGTLRFLL